MDAHLEQAIDHLGMFQDGRARACALVSIAQSLAVIASALNDNAAPAAESE